ncbi:hypothetical protein PtA15_5A361 [Puccinia triticina]|uniref:Uncharacterized protein n=1 Tax=Puccinia triticina TaxID=208348 RepID=A0ABY7CHV2_9BASI|nr:uncharacterized protein PtA15_5A361 [Puccinia triticina]WAQ84788.1 hypothetical protein PtA15_5A361 [Puccinia triticina]
MSNERLNSNLELNQPLTTDNPNGDQMRPPLNDIERSALIDQQLAPLFTTEENEAMLRAQSDTPSSNQQRPISPTNREDREESVQSTIIVETGAQARRTLIAEGIIEDPNNNANQTIRNLTDTIRASFALYLATTRNGNWNLAREILTQAINTQQILEDITGPQEMRRLSENWNPENDRRLLNTNVATNHQQTPAAPAPNAAQQQTDQLNYQVFQQAPMPAPIHMQAQQAGFNPGVAQVNPQQPGFNREWVAPHMRGRGNFQGRRPF